MRTIELTKGKCAMVDDKDYEMLNKHSWALHSGGYACSRVKGTFVLMHSFLLGKTRGMEIDHKDRNKLNNQRSNLRFVTRSENCFNVGLRVTNKTGVKGVCWDKRRKKWRATLKLNYKQVFNKSFSEKEDAIQAREKAFRRLVPLLK